MQRQLTVSVMEMEDGHVTVLMTVAVRQGDDWCDTAVEAAEVDVKMPVEALAWDSKAVRVIRDQVLGGGGVGEALRGRVARMVADRG